MNVEMSIEDQIAEHYVAPAPEKRICQWGPSPGYPACTTPLARSNRESLCYRHAQLGRTLKTIKDFSRKTEPDMDPYAFPKQLRLCAVKDCHRNLTHNNKSGRCAGHYFIQQGMQMKDGSIPRPVPIAPIETIAPIEPLAPIQPLQPIDLDPLATPTTRLAGSEHSRIDGEVTPVTRRDALDQPTAEAVAKDDGITRQEAERREGQASNSEKEEMTPVSEQTTTEDPKHFRECAVKDCHEAIGAHNTSGRCTGHFYIKRGMVMKDGTIPKPHTPLSAGMKRAKIKNAAAGITGKNKHKKALPAPTVLPPEPSAVAVADDHISLKVPIEAIDRFLLNLSMEDKTRIVEREIFGGQ